MYEAALGRAAGSRALIRVHRLASSNPEANDTAAEFIREKIRDDRQGSGDGRARSRRVSPIGTKRICVDTDYFETYNRDNVDAGGRCAKTPITEITAAACAPAGGRVRARRHRVRHRLRRDDRRAARDRHPRPRRRARCATKWEAGPRTYLGMQAPGFPNMFMVTGPGQPVGAEQHGRGDRAARRLDQRTASRSRRRRLDRSRPGDGEAEGAGSTMSTSWRLATLYPDANSWYMGANIPGKTRVFMPYVGGCGPYRSGATRSRPRLRGVRARLSERTGGEAEKWSTCKQLSQDG